MSVQPGNLIQTNADTPETYTYDDIHAVINLAADDILEAVDAPDEGVRDGLNLLVNVTLHRLRDRDLSLAEIVESNYDEVSLDDVIRWIQTAC